MRCFFQALVPAWLAVTHVNGLPGGFALTNDTNQSGVTDENTTMWTNATECPAEFTEPFYAFFFDEACLANLQVPPSMGCPIKAVDDFMLAMFGELNVWSLCLAPWVYLGYLAVALCETCPDRTQGLVEWVCFAVWFILQVIGILAIILPLAMYVIGYVNLTVNFHPCFLTVHSGALLHLVVPPLWVAMTPIVNKVCPLYLLSFVLWQQTMDEDDMSINVQETRLYYIFWIPYLVSAIYSMGTLGFFASLAFWPVIAVPIGLCWLGLYCIARVFESGMCSCGLFVAVRERFGFDVESFAGMAARVLGRAGSRKNYIDDLLFWPVKYMLVAPSLILGTTAVVLSASLCDVADVLKLESRCDVKMPIYGYVFDIDGFRLPSPADVVAWVESPPWPQDWNEFITELVTFELPPAKVLRDAAGISTLVTITSVLQLAWSICTAIAAFMGGYSFKVRKALGATDQELEDLLNQIPDTLESLPSMSQADHFRLVKAYVIAARRLIGMRRTWHWKVLFCLVFRCKPVEKRHMIYGWSKRTDPQMPWQPPMRRLLELAVQLAADAGNVDFVRFIYARTDFFDHRINQTDLPLRACECHDVAMVKLLTKWWLEAKVVSDESSPPTQPYQVRLASGKTMAMCACGPKRTAATDEDLMPSAASSNLELVEYLWGADQSHFYAKDNAGCSVAHYACSVCSADVVLFLRKTVHIDFDEAANDGRTPAMCASRCGLLLVVRCLHQEIGVDFEARDGCGKTAAMHASENGHLEVVKYLLEEVLVDFGVKDQNNKSAFELAAEGGHLETVQYLQGGEKVKL